MHTKGPQKIDTEKETKNGEQIIIENENRLDQHFVDFPIDQTIKV